MYSILPHLLAFTNKALMFLQQGTFAITCTGLSLDWYVLLHLHKHNLGIIILINNIKYISYELSAYIWLHTRLMSFKNISTNRSSLILSQHKFIHKHTMKFIYIYSIYTEKIINRNNITAIFCVANLFYQHEVISYWLETKVLLIHRSILLISFVFLLVKNTFV